MDWDWRPAPVFQSYAAFIPALDRLDAEHYESARAADLVLLNFPAIDGRHPFLETPVLWRALMDRYDFKLAGAGYLLLERQGHRFAPSLAAGKAAVRWRRDLAVPKSAEMLIMSAHIRPTLRGALTSLLLRTAPVYMQATFQSGRTARWRAVPENPAAGFPIHPFAEDLAQLQMLFAPRITVEWWRMPAVQ